MASSLSSAIQKLEKETPKKKRDSLLITWDFTLHLPKDQVYTEPFISDENLPEPFKAKNLCKFLSEIAKSWAFQLEVGDETHKFHYQGRLKLKQQKRQNQVIGYFTNYISVATAHISPTSSANIFNMNYCQKEKTRVNGDPELVGPFHDEAFSQILAPKESVRIRDLTEANLYQWQRYIYNMSKDYADPRSRIIHVLVEYEGCKGKSVLTELLATRSKCLVLPPARDFKDIVHAAQNMISERKLDPPMILIDLPRSIDKSGDSQMYAALESIKNGYVYDMRHRFKETRLMNTPHVWVFTNKDPDLQYLSQDRWRFWTINKDNQLEPHVPQYLVDKVNANAEESDPEKKLKITPAEDRILQRKMSFPGYDPENKEYLKNWYEAESERFHTQHARGLPKYECSEEQLAFERSLVH